MPRETEFVKASELRDGNFGHPQDELPHGRGRVTKILNDSGILSIHAENGVVIRDMHATIERYVR